MDIWPLWMLLPLLPMLWRQEVDQGAFGTRGTDPPGQPMGCGAGRSLVPPPPQVSLACLPTQSPLGKVLPPKNPENPFFFFLCKFVIPVIQRLGSLNKPRITWSVPVNAFLVFLFKTLLKAFCSQLCGSQQPLLPSTSEHVGASILVGRKQKNHTNLIFPLIPHISYMLFSLFIASDIIPLVRFYAWSHLGQF